MSTLTASEVIDTMCARFTSGNSIPVERAHIKREEWEALMKVIAVTQPDVLDVLKALRRNHSMMYPHHEDLCALCKQADAAIAQCGA